MNEQKYDPLYKKSKALIVGVNTYIAPNVSPLFEAENDAIKISNLLQSPDYGFEVKKLLGRRATKKAILEALHKLRSTGPDDRIFIYFACHGYTRSDNFGNEKGFIAVTDTDPSKDFTAIGLEEITDLRLNANAKHIAFIFDTCFSGQALGLTRTTSLTTDKFLTRRAYQVISAGAGDQTVSDFRSMTTHMIDGIKNKEAENNGIVTLNSLGFYLQQTISSDTSQTQIPQFGHLKGSQGGDFIFSLKNLEKMPLSTSLLLPISTKKSINNFPQKGVYTAEVDLIGRIDAVNHPTAMSISAGLSVSLLISSSDKLDAIQKIKNLKPQWGKTRIHVYLYTNLVYLLIRNHIDKLDYVTIDIEYEGYEPIIKAKLINMLRRDGKDITKNKIRFQRLDKKSSAHVMATRVFDQKAAPDWRITAEDLQLD